MGYYGRLLCGILGLLVVGEASAGDLSVWRAERIGAPALKHRDTAE